MKRARANIVFLGGICLCAFVETSAAEDRIDHLDKEAIARGAGVYATHCGACHGANLEGQPNWQVRDADGYLPAPPHNVSGHTWHHPDAQLFAITKYGTAVVVGNGYQSNMSAFGETLSDVEIWAVLSYIKSTWPPRVISIHDEINAAYEAAQQ